MTPSPDDGCCAKCGQHMSTPFGLDPTEVCNLCAQEFYAAHQTTPSPDTAFEAALRRIDEYADAAVFEAKVGRLADDGRKAEARSIAEEAMRAIWTARGEADARVCEAIPVDDTSHDPWDSGFEAACERCATAIRGMK